MTEIKQLNTIDEFVNFATLTKTDHASYFAECLKNKVFVTNGKSYFVYDNSKKLFIEQNEGQYHTYFCDYINVIVKKIKVLILTIKCKCFDDVDQCECGAKYKRKQLVNLAKDFDTKTYLKDVSERSYGKLYDTEFDKKINNISYLLPLKNGRVIDLKTLIVRDRTVDDKFTFECPVSYLPNSNFKNANKFFMDVMPDEKEREYLRKSLGYMLTGEVDARAFFIWYGNGSNGKSVILDLLMKILDKYYVSADKSVFCKTDNKSSGAASPHIYALLGKRMIGYSEGETSDNFELNLSVLKQISGDDELSCRGLYKDQITFKSCGKLNFATNNIPRLSKEDAVVNRTRMINFNQEFVEKPTGNQKLKDTQFTDNLKTIYLDEVFSWICQGSKIFYESRKIIMPETFQEQTDKFIHQEDSIASFLDNRLEYTKNQKDSIKKNDIFNAYNEYCKEAGLRCQARSILFTRLDHKKITLTCLNGYPVYRGIKIKEVPQEDDPIEHGINKEERKIEQIELPIKLSIELPIKLSIEEQIKNHEEQIKQLYKQQLDDLSEKIVMVNKKQIIEKKVEEITIYNKNSVMSLDASNFMIIF